MLPRLVVVCLASLLALSTIVNADETLKERNVIFVVDSGEMGETNRNHVLRFTEHVAKDAFNKGANVGMIFGDTSMINSPSQFKALPFNEKIEQTEVFLADASDAWNHMIDSGITSSNLAVALSHLVSNFRFQLLTFIDRFFFRPKKSKLAIIFKVPKPLLFLSLELKTWTCTKLPISSLQLTSLAFDQPLFWLVITSSIWPSHLA